MTLFGLLNINKPSGITSRQAVDRVKRFVKPAKVGHAGTLDPLACGVLVVAVGQATRLVEYVQQMPKRYRATFLLGRTSNTEDIEGEVTPLVDAPRPTREQLERAVVELTGEIQQRPPAFSALKVQGQRAYARARAGQTVELAPRAVHVYRLEVVAYEYPELRLDVECSAGTYVRSLGRDLAERVGSGAVMSALQRTVIGRFAIDQAVETDRLTRENVADFLLPATAAVDNAMPLCTVSEADATRLSHGLPIASEALVPAPESGETGAEVLAAVDGTGRLTAILTRRFDGTYGPDKYFPVDR